MSLDFKNLPLLRTEYSLTFRESASVSLDQLFALRDELRDEVPQVTDFSGPSGPFNISFGNTAGVGLDDIQKGMGLALRQDRIFAAWQKLRPDCEYVRFAVLADLLQKGVDLLDPRPSISIVVGLYANLVPKDQPSVHRLISPDLFPHLPGDKAAARDIRLYWSLPEGDFRLNVYAVEEGAMIETMLSRHSSDNLGDDLEAVHSGLLSIFESIITEEAKNVWQLEIA